MLMAAHPIRVVHQRTHHLLVQTSRRAEVDVFHAGWTLQPAVPEPPLQCPILPPVPLPVHQQGKAFLEAELRRLRLFLLLGESVGHAAHAHGVQFLDSSVG
jgi:hypothetical protein